MPLDQLFVFVLLLIAVSTAFAVSSIVGMVVAGRWTTRYRIDGAPDELGSRSASADAAERESAGRPPTDHAGPIEDSVLLTSPHDPARWGTLDMVQLRSS